MKVDAYIDDLTGQLTTDPTKVLHQVETRPYNSPAQGGAGRFYIQFFWAKNQNDPLKEAHLTPNSVALVFRDWVRDPKERQQVSDGGMDITPVSTASTPPGQPESLDPNKDNARSPSDNTHGNAGGKKNPK